MNRGINELLKGYLDIKTTAKSLLDKADELYNLDAISAKEYTDFMIMVLTMKNWGVIE